MNKGGIILLFSTFICIEVSAGDPSAEMRVSTLCHDSESISFNCKISDKYASLCKQSFHGKEIFQYRYGTQDKVEMAYPKSTEGSREQFKSVYLNEGSANVNAVYFVNGIYRYNMSIPIA